MGGSGLSFLQILKGLAGRPPRTTRAVLGASARAARYGHAKDITQMASILALASSEITGRRLATDTQAMVSPLVSRLLNG